MNAFRFTSPSGSSVTDWSQGIVVDNFAGGGGASTGIAWALGRDPDVAVNHDEPAVAMHFANHPGTRHFCQSVWKADPMEVTQGRPVLLGWFSPDCKHFSKAKGGKPVAKNIRDLAWVVVHWAQRIGKTNLKVFILENVEEFQDWGPLIETDKGWMPDPKRKGEEFRKWVAALKKAGATAIEWRELRACDYGAPTIRKRLFVIVRFDGEPIAWPEPTHGAPKSEAVQSGALKPWKTAADIIDWSIPCPSIFERDRPLREATCRRIAAGIMRYVVNAAKPFIVPLTHHGSANRVYDIDNPMVTVTGAHRGELAVVEPFIVGAGGAVYGGKPQPGDEPINTVTCNTRFAVATAHITKFRNGAIGHGADEPLHTVTANSFIKRSGGAAPLGVVEATLQPADKVAAFMAQHNSGFYEGNGRPADAPVSTVTVSGSQQGVVTSHLVKLRGTCADGQPVDEPMPTLTAGGMHVGEVRAFLIKYYGNETGAHDLEEPLGTVTTRERFGLVTVNIGGEEYVIADIGMRMLTPRELARAQGFPDDYVLDPVCWYTTDSGARKFGALPKSQQIAKIGNSVCPVMAKVLAAANCVDAEPMLEAAE